MVLHFSLPPRLDDLASCIMADIGYICQYSILKGASNHASLIWIGCQGGLALLRVGVWTFDPTFDDHYGGKSGYAIFNNTKFEAMSPIELITALSPVTEETRIATWVWDYLRITDLRDILGEAIRSTDLPSSIVMATYCLLDVNFQHVLNSRSKPPLSSRGNNNSRMWRLGFHLFCDEGGQRTVRPFGVIKLSPSW